MPIIKLARLVRSGVVAAGVLGSASVVHAQSIELAPFGGYRFGGDFFELMARQRLDIDGAPALGLALDVPLSNGLQVEGFFTHQDATVDAPGVETAAPARRHMLVEHYQVGGLQEFGGPQVRPFLTGTVGLTRYAVDADNEVRFSLSAGGGVKLFASRHAGVRLDGRLFSTFIDADAQALACAPTRGCVSAFRINVVWQAEFTAGVVVKF
jgi:hypothetical protein